ncbi:PRKC apoptosis WT1 regulator protein isoform 1-T2 [Synchiropus picturatus]
MATGGFKSNATTDFLEEWKAKREKMRAKMLGDIAAATGAPLAVSSSSTAARHAASDPAAAELGCSPDRGASAGNSLPSSHSPVVRSASGGAIKSPEEDMQPPAHPAAAAAAAAAAPAGSVKKPQCSSPDFSTMTGNDSDKESPSPGKSKDKKSTGPSARKGKGQIEKRKMREKRRSTGVVSMPSNESLDELDDDDTGEKERQEEDELVQANTFQNEAMTAEPTTGQLVETPRPGGGRQTGSVGSEEESLRNSRPRRSRQERERASSTPLEKRLEDLEKELAREHQENARLLKANQDKDDIIVKLKDEIDFLNRDLDDLEDENEQLKQENKTLLKVVGQLTR